MWKLILTILLITAGATAHASEINRACLGSERGAGKHRLCGCIQQAADSSLSRGDRQRAADLFKNPDMAQRIRQSNRRSDEKFWERYEGFVATAQNYCS